MIAVILNAFADAAFVGALFLAAPAVEALLERFPRRATSFPVPASGADSTGEPR